ncbi:TIGR03943 family protein [Synechococcus sp. CC9311]|uniref:TIGR03943 family putative permease subunit n=1 Tax=Synechococcus sp. (strain CC9311) TaxID=64471 RepID=UPI0002D32BD2|nr:TIGR03943 family protein [Synechococcus sp. CC9311]
MARLNWIRQTRYLPPLVLLLWGWVLVWSSVSARLDLLLNAVFHPVVAIAGVVLMVLGAVQLRSAPRLKTSPAPLSWLVAIAVACLVLLFPPSPSFSDLAANRSENLPEAPRLSFFLPPEQRTLTEWVRLLRSQPDPNLHAGDPVRISGFVLQRPGMEPQLARLTVRCCLADATPAGLPIEWPATADPQPDEWLAIEGTMTTQIRDGLLTNVVKPSTITVIPRPERPLEP